MFKDAAVDSHVSGRHGFTRNSIGYHVCSSETSLCFFPGPVPSLDRPTTFFVHLPVLLTSLVAVPGSVLMVHSILRSHLEPF